MLVYSILYIGVQYTVYWCTVYCILVYSILYIGVQYTVYWCTVYCILVYSIVYIGVQYSVYRLTALLFWLISWWFWQNRRKLNVKRKLNLNAGLSVCTAEDTPYVVKAVVLKLTSSQFRDNFTVILLLLPGTVFILHCTVRYRTVLMWQTVTLHCTVRYRTVLMWQIDWDTALYCAVPYCVDVTDCDTALYCVVPYCVNVTDGLGHCTVLYGTVLCWCDR